MEIKSYDSLSEAYLNILKDVYENPDFVHDAITATDITTNPQKSSNPVTKNPNWYFNKSGKQEKSNYHFGRIHFRFFRRGFIGG